MFWSKGNRRWWQWGWWWDVSLKQNVFNISGWGLHLYWNYFWSRSTARKHKTSLGIPRWPVDEGLGVALSINLEEPISALVCPHAVLTQTRWETSEWVTVIQPNPEKHITNTKFWLRLENTVSVTSARVLVEGKPPPPHTPVKYIYTY